MHILSINNPCKDSNCPHCRPKRTSTTGFISVGMCPNKLSMNITVTYSDKDLEDVMVIKEEPKHIKNRNSLNLIKQLNNRSRKSVRWS